MLVLGCHIIIVLQLMTCSRKKTCRSTRQSCESHKLCPNSVEDTLFTAVLDDGSG